MKIRRQEILKSLRENSHASILKGKKKEKQKNSSEEQLRCGALCEETAPSLDVEAVS